MDFTAQHKREIEGKIIDVITHSLEQGKLAEDDLPKIADFVLGRVDALKDHEELVAFFYELSKKWPIFDNLEDLERGEVKEVIEDKVEEQVLTLAKNGKIEEAIKLAKSLTD